MRIMANSIKPANYHEQQDFMKEFAKAFWEKSMEWGKNVGGYRRGHTVFKQMVQSGKPSGCSSCAMAMLFRPKMRLKFWRDFFSSPVAQAKTLLTFAARTVGWVQVKLRKKIKNSVDPRLEKHPLSKS